MNFLSPISDKRYAHGKAMSYLRSNRTGLRDTRLLRTMESYAQKVNVPSIYMARAYNSLTLSCACSGQCFLLQFFRPHFLQYFSCTNLAPFVTSIINLCNSVFTCLHATGIKLIVSIGCKTWVYLRKKVSVCFRVPTWLFV